jgi:uncharacterized Tic20 family protein
MTDPNTPDPTQPPPYSPGGYGQPGPAPTGGYGPPGGYTQPGSAQPGQPGQPGQYPPPGGYAQAPVTQSDERTWATLGHAGGIFIGFVAGLIVYLIYKDRSAYLRDQGREALNFQITVAIATFALLIITTIITAVTFGIGGVLLPLVYLPLLGQLIFGILAAVAANKHENYRYPFTLRLVK